MKQYKLLNDGGFSFACEINFPIIVKGYNLNGSRLVRVPCDEFLKFGVKKNVFPIQGYFNFVLGSEAELVK